MAICTSIFLMLAMDFVHIFVRMHRRGCFLIVGMTMRRDFVLHNIFRRWGSEISRTLFLVTTTNDHVSDLRNLLSVANVEVFIRNRSVDVAQLRRLKLENGLLTNGLQTMLTMHETYVHSEREIDFGGVGLTVFYNDYPSFSDTNNLKCCVICRL